jgi:hypothetical protein
MATTPTYSWPIPDDTDLVKDGAKAIRDLGNAVDATVSSVPTGLVHIETQTFSAVAAHSVNDVFSADYDNYKIVTSFAPSTTSQITIRMRVSGADNTTANYERMGILVGNTSNNVRVNTTGATSWILTSTAGKITTTIDLFDPFNTATSIGQTHTYDDTTKDARLWTISQMQSISFDGFSLISGTGNITGSVSVYGYAKA